MLLTKTNSKTSFSGGNIPVFKTTKAEDDLFNLGVSSWVETGDRFIRTDSSGKVTGLLDRANSDVLIPVSISPTKISAGITALHFNNTPVLGGVDVFADTNIQTIVTVMRASLGTVDTIIGSQAADKKPLMLFVDRPDDSKMRYLQHFPDNQINSTKPIKGIGWFSCVLTYNLPNPQAVFYVNGEQVTAPGPVSAALSTAVGARKLVVGGAGPLGAQNPGTFDFALSIVIPNVDAYRDQTALAKINAYLAEFMPRLTA
ncbi:TPA: hypothetical protein ACXIJW_002359 [Serratia marcescens]